MSEQFELTNEQQERLTRYAKIADLIEKLFDLTNHSSYCNDINRQRRFCCTSSKRENNIASLKSETKYFLSKRYEIYGFPEDLEGRCGYSKDFSCSIEPKFKSPGCLANACDSFIEKLLQDYGIEYDLNRIVVGLEYILVDDNESYYNRLLDYIGEMVKIVEDSSKVLITRK